MRMRMISTRYSQVLSNSAGDRVMIGMSLPSDTIINEIRARVRMVSSQHTLAFNNVIGYAVAMYLLPVLDPDLADTYADVWDQLVEKDDDLEVSGLDLDTVGLDTDNFWEPGEHNWHDIYDVGLRPRKLHGRYKFLTQNDAVMQVHDTVTPFTVIWQGGDKFEFRIRRRLYVEQPSVLVMALAAPVMSDTTSVQEVIFAENKWSQLKYMRQVLERSLMNAIGLFEAGAETPFVEASVLLTEHLNPNVFEQSSGAMIASAFNAFTEVSIDHSVLGDMGQAVLETERRTI